MEHNKVTIMTRNNDNAAPKIPTFPTPASDKSMTANGRRKGLFSKEYPFDWYELQFYLDGLVFSKAA
jgi:hypothetical protein